MSVIHTPRKPDLDLRVMIFPTLLSLVFVVIFLKLWYIQVVKAPELAERAQMFQTSKAPKLAPRGLIFDRNGLLLAGVRPSIALTAIPAIVKKNPWVIDKVADVIDEDLGLNAKIDRKKLREKLSDANWKPYLPSPILIGLSIRTATRIAESADELPGLGVESQPVRFYPDNVNFTHVLGYVSTPNRKDMDRIAKEGLHASSYVGKLGVEFKYEKQLMGAPGSDQIEVDAKRRPIRVVGRDNAVPGDQLNLSIDASCQKLAMQLLAGRKGSVVAIDPRNGEVLCLVSSPSYDLSLFQNGISSTDYKRLSDDPAIPQLNRAIASFNSPGSTFKLVTSIAAAEAGKFDTNMVVNCPGYIRVGRRVSKCLGVHGNITFYRALSQSCNTYFSQLGLDAGPDRLREAALDSGLGAKAGIDLRGELTGIVPTDKWIKIHRKGGRWFPGDTVNLAIGQGELQVSPLQMADMMALVANDGLLYRPHLVRSFKRPGDNSTVHEVQPEVYHKVDLPSSFWSELKQGLVDVVQQGTARGSEQYLTGVVWGAKTGSAEHGISKSGKTHSWFIGFAPADQPKIAICVFVEAAGHGGEIAAPIGAQVMKRYLFGDPAKAASKASAALAASSAPAGSPARRSRV